MRELRAAMALLEGGITDTPLKMLTRVVRAQEQLTDAWQVLKTLTPADYLQFRHAFGRASGFQSVSYRTVEFLLGNRREVLLRPHAHRPAEHAALEADLRGPSLYDLTLRLLAARDLPIGREVLDRDLTQLPVLDETTLAAWLAVYEDPQTYWDLYELAEKLLDVEDNFRRWRFNHLTTVERTIGFKRRLGRNQRCGLPARRARRGAVPGAVGGAHPAVTPFGAGRRAVPSHHEHRPARAHAPPCALRRRPRGLPRVLPAVPRQRGRPALRAVGEGRHRPARGLRQGRASTASSACRCPRSTAAPGSARTSASTRSSARSAARPASAGFAVGITLHNDVCLPYFLEYANEEQKQRWLPGIVSGELITAVAMTEPGTGSDLAGDPHQGDRAGRRQLPHGRRQDVHHQRHQRRPRHHRGQDRPDPAPPRPVDVHRRARHAGLRARPQPREGRHALPGHRRAVLQRGARPGREPARRGGAGLPDPRQQPRPGAPLDRDPRRRRRRGRARR